MQVSANDFEQLLREHEALLRAYRDAQSRCSEQLTVQAREIARLQAQAIRLRAAVVRRDSALAWEKEDRAELERSIPGLPRRVELAREVGSLQARIRDLMRAQDGGGRSPFHLPAGPEQSCAGAPENLEASLAEADLVICQAGCMSHGAYWRVQDHCRRTGKACVQVEQPNAMRIVRIHRAADGAATARVTPHEAV